MSRKIINCLSEQATLEEKAIPQAIATAVMELLNEAKYNYIHNIEGAQSDIFGALENGVCGVHRISMTATVDRGIPYLEIETCNGKTIHIWVEGV